MNSRRITPVIAIKNRAGTAINTNCIYDYIAVLPM